MAGELNGAVVAIPYAVANAVTNAADVDLTKPGGNTITVMPKAGSVVGLLVNATADLTAGSATFEVHKDGTELAEESAPVLTLDDTHQEIYGLVRSRALRFAAGDGLGVSYSSTTDAAPTNTNDYDAVLLVEFDID